VRTLHKSLRHFNFRLYFALLLLGLCPTIYTSVRIFFLGQLPSEWAYSIAGQLGWVNLLYEILNEAILLPLFYFIGQVVQDHAAFTNRVKTGLLAAGSIYAVFSLVIILAANPLLTWMAADKSILSASASYIRIESIANLLGMLSSFVLVALVTLNKGKYLYILTAVRLVLSLLSDTFLVSALPFSLRLGVNGIGYSNILVNGLLLTVSLVLLSREGIHVFNAKKMSFAWMEDFIKVGSISGLESFVRNIAYMLMIVRMVNVVNEQGVYWVANSFIWGWLLLPVTQLGELIKQEVSTDHNAVQTHSIGYFGITGIICLLWVISIPFWKPFMAYILGYTDVDRLFDLVLLLIGFYVLYAFQNVFDATFYALGKTNYMLFESIATNTVYYAAAYLFYRFGLWIPTLTGIVLLFGFGIAFDSVVSFAAYLWLLKKEKIHI
jgi:Na+-driven multidrug efflux pump